MTNPFNEGAAIAKAFDMAAKGTTRAAIILMCEKTKVTSPRIFHCLRREAYGEQTWTFNQDADGNIKLTAKGSKKVETKKPEAKKAAKVEAKAKKVETKKPVNKLAKEESKQADKREAKAKKAAKSPKVAVVEVKEEVKAA
jgi:hypothetical protein